MKRCSGRRDVGGGTVRAGVGGIDASTVEQQAIVDGAADDAMPWVRQCRCGVGIVEVRAHWGRGAIC